MQLSDPEKRAERLSPQNAAYLPPQSGCRLRIASGNGERCALCDEQIRSAEARYDLRQCPTQPAEVWHFHAMCFRFWESAGGSALPE